MGKKENPGSVVFDPKGEWPWRQSLVAVSPTLSTLQSLLGLLRSLTLSFEETTLLACSNAP